MVVRVVFWAMPGCEFFTQDFHFVFGKVAALLLTEGVVLFQVQGIEIGSFDEDVRVQFPEVKPCRSDIGSLTGSAYGFDRNVHEVGGALHGTGDGDEYPGMIEYQHLFGLPEGAVAFTCGFHGRSVQRFGVRFSLPRAGFARQATHGRRSSSGISRRRGFQP